MSGFKKIIRWSLLLFLLGLLAGSGIGYWLFFKANVDTHGSNAEYLYVPTGTDFEGLVTILSSKKQLASAQSFRWAAQIKKFTKVKSGRYRLFAGMNNNFLINKLRAGIQEPVVVNLNAIHTKEQLAGRLGRKLELDSTVVMAWLNNAENFKKWGFSSRNIMAMFMPQSYELLWTISLPELMEKLHADYSGYWTDERRAKAKEIGLTPVEVITLASIVECEQSRFDDEKPTIAGLYLNRLHDGIPLQSDPTLVYATGNFAVNRVLNADKQVSSPYNTYKNNGLPPGPIILPEKSSVESVLHYLPNDYYYMCAKEDLSGRHHFSANLDQHNRFAKKYREALDKHNIRR